MKQFTNKNFTIMTKKQKQQIEFAVFQELICKCGEIYSRQAIENLNNILMLTAALVTEEEKKLYRDAVEELSKLQNRAIKMREDI
jgi:hypothetical protein